jgi:hypothetical protein
MMLRSVQFGDSSASLDYVTRHSLKSGYHTVLDNLVKHRSHLCEMQVKSMLRSTRLVIDAPQ